MKNFIKVSGKNDEKRHDVHVEPNSTWLNYGIKTLEQLKDWILVKLGYPLLTVELTDEQLNCAISDGISLYSKYAFTPEQYLSVNLKFYKPGFGIDLSEFKIMSIKDMAFQRDNIFGMQNDMFFGMYAFMGQGAGGPMFGMGEGNYVGSWVTYHNMHEFFDLCKRMTGSNPDWFYDKNTKILRLMPEPRMNGDRNQFILLTCNVEPPMEEYYGNEYCRRLCLAEAKILLGTIRKKFSSVALLGGGQIDTSIGDEGQQEREKLVEELQKSESKGQFCVIM